jgi:dipeptidyl aminopeptidase/acylaminoacyl peptidase
VNVYEEKNIYALLLDGGAPARRIISSTVKSCDPSFSPRGERIAFRSTRSGSDEIWIVERDGSLPRRLTHLAGPPVGSPRWSPDGSRIAFDARPDARSQIFVIGAGGGNHFALTAGPGASSQPRWSQDGKWIYFASDRSGRSEIWRQRVDEGVAARVTEGGGANAAESDDGKTLYYARGGDPPGIFELALDGSLPAEGRRLVDLKPGFTGHWTIGKNGIYFVQPGDALPGSTASLHLFDLATRRARLVAPLPGIPSAFDGGLAISPDQTTVMFTVLDRAGSNIVIGGR